MEFIARLCRYDLTSHYRLPTTVRDSRGDDVGKLVEVWFAGGYTCGKIILTNPVEADTAGNLYSKITLDFHGVGL